MPNAAAQRIYVPECVQVASSLLNQLRGTHRALIGEICQMEALTAEPKFDPARCMARRWKISQAGLARHTLSARICDYLAERCEPQDVELVQEVRNADRELLRCSAGHVSTWRAQTIGADWRGYCQASREIRARLFEQVKLEQRLLYPLLEDCARRR